jgi:hypothetical protein
MFLPMNMVLGASHSKPYKAIDFLLVMMRARVDCIDIQGVKLLSTDVADTDTT